MRVVLDSNVIVSAFLIDAGAPARILDRVRQGEITWVLSTTILQEVARILSLPRIRKRYRVDPDSVIMLVTLLGEKAVRIPGVVRIEGKSRDPKDDPILACAVEGQAAYLVTGDEDLLVLEEHEGIPIVTPADFLERLGH